MLLSYYKMLHEVLLYYKILCEVLLYEIIESHTLVKRVPMPWLGIKQEHVL